MHVVFVSVGYADLLSVEMLSACLARAGHRASLVHDPALFHDRFDLHLPALARVLERRAHLVRRILALEPDLLAFSCITPTFAWAVEVARAVRTQRRVTTVFGGVHPSALPEFALSYDAVDLVCQGEGEATLVELADALAAGGEPEGILGLWTKRNGEAQPPPGPRPFVADLDALPFADKELYADAFPLRSTFNIMGSRGCLNRCTFCFNSHFGELAPTSGGAGYLRRRTVEGVMEELTRGLARFDFNLVEFHDDIFTFDRGWALGLLERYRARIGRPFLCSTHAQFVNLEVARALRDAGCVRMKMGIQSLEPREWKIRVLRRSEREEDIARAIDVSRRIGLRVEVDHILGLPGETPEGLAHALAFYREHTPDRIATYWLSYFPGTQITRRAIAEGRLAPEQIAALNRGEVQGFHGVQFDDDPDLPLKRGYAAAFHLLPLVPLRLRRQLDPRALARVPGAEAFARWSMAGAMLGSVARGEGYEALNYLRYYTHQLGRRARRR